MVDTNSETTAGNAAVERSSRVVPAPIAFVVQDRRVVQAGVDLSAPTTGVGRVDGDHECLRFDICNRGVHYHHRSPSTKADVPFERVVAVDTVAEGDPVSWAINRTRGRLVPMPASAGGRRLVELLEEDTLGRAVDEVEGLIRAAQAREAPA